MEPTPSPGGESEASRAALGVPRSTCEGRRGRVEQGQHSGGVAVDYAAEIQRNEARRRRRLRYKRALGPQSEVDTRQCEVCQHEGKRAKCLAIGCKARLCTERTQDGKVRFLQECYLPHMRYHSAEENSQAQSTMSVFLENMATLRT